MYVPPSFHETDEARVDALLARNPFATLITPTPERLWISHVPLLARRRQGALVLEGHLARANGHWQALQAGTETTAVFHGPHAYVSPTWYATAPAVPTWNYAVVHAVGRADVRDNAEDAAALVTALTNAYESGRPDGWRADGLPTELRRSLLGAIVAFELRVAHLEAKFKLGQNRGEADRIGAIVALEAAGTDDTRALAALMRATLADG